MKGARQSPPSSFAELERWARRGTELLDALAGELEEGLEQELRSALSALMGFTSRMHLGPNVTYVDTGLPLHIPQEVPMEWPDPADQVDPEGDEEA